MPCFHCFIILHQRQTKLYPKLSLLTHERWRIRRIENSVLIVRLRLLHESCLCLAANGKSVDATQELIAIGISNIGNAFVQAFPGTGSLSRSAVNNASGVRTPFGGVYTGEFLRVARACDSCKLIITSTYTRTT